MKYGHFDNQHREYVIDQVDLPVSWTNYIGTGDMYGVFNHTAGGYLLYKSPEYHRITRFRPNSVPMDGPGHYVYLSDEDDGDYWSISWQPVGKPKEFYSCRHGLSYSTFEYSNLKIDNEAKTSSEAITLTFDIKNTGNVAADEVAQLYLSPTAKDQNIRPIQMQGFARVHLEKGETKTVSIKMYTEQFGYYTNNDGNRQWNIAPGKFTVKIGASSQDIKLKQDIALTGDKVNKPLRECYFSETTIK